MMIVTFKNNMIITLGPWHKGRVLGQHTCPYGLYDERRRTTTTTTNDDDDERKKTDKTKCVSNDRSGHDDQNAYRIIKNGAILAYF